MNVNFHPPWPPDTRFLHVGGLVVDLRFRQIIAPAGVDLPLRLFDLLLLLISEPHTLHTRTELFERLWPGLVVEDANLTQSVWLLRKALGEERKQWIRTVAKGGYVFEPPGVIETWMELPAAFSAAPTPTAEAIETAPPAPYVDASHPSVDEATSAVSASPAVPVAVARRPARRWLAVTAAVAGVALVVTLAAWLNGTPGKPASSFKPEPLTVALVRVEDPGNAVQWPARLLQEWVKWKLGSLPEITLLSEADLAAGVGAAPARIVFLASDEAPGDSKKILLRARFQEAGREQRIEMEGEPAQIPAMVDDMSKQILQRLAPVRAAQSWPKLELDDRAAQRYADVAQAMERRDWMTVAKIGSEVVELAPRFGLAHAQLAVAQSRLAQAASAIEQIDMAIELLQPAPTDVTDLLKAQRLALDPMKQPEAADAYGRLLARYPDKASFVLQYASMLVRSDRPKDALPLLLDLNREQASMGLRIARLIALAETYQALGDPARMRESARAAERLASGAGPGWELESGTALLMVASADSRQYGPRADTRLYEQAAERLEHAGNGTAALYARFLGEVLGPPRAGANARLDSLLAQANAGGYRDIEINILFHLGQQSYSTGDLPGYRKRLEQAASIAEVSGNVASLNRIDTMLLADDILCARLANADRRVQRLGKTKSQGSLGLAIDKLEATLASIRGQGKKAIEVLNRAERNFPSTEPGSALSIAQSQLSCSLVEQRLSLGELGTARTDIKRCTNATDATLQAQLLVLRALTERLAGDREAARSALHQAEPLLTALGNNPDQWTLTIEVAGLLTRLGDTQRSDQLLEDLSKSIGSSGYVLVTALVQTGLAENAAARGDWAGSRGHAAAARSGLPNDAWIITSRLDLLDAAAALASGDRATAIALASKVHEQAHRLGDVPTQMEVHSLLPGVLLDDGNPRSQDLLIARTGMRGATLDWLQQRNL